MAVRAKHGHIGFGIDGLGAFEFRNGFEMVNVDEIFAVFAVEFFKIKAAAFAAAAVNSESDFSKFRVSLVSCNVFLLFAAFDERFKNIFITILLISIYDQNLIEQSG